MGIVKGPFRVWYQNLAHDQVWSRLRPEFGRIIDEIDEVGSEKAEEQRWQKRTRSINAIHDLLDNKLGSLWREGRAKVWVFRSTEDRRQHHNPLTVISVAWYFKRQHSLGCDLSIDAMEQEWTASLRVPRAGFYISAPLPKALWRQSWRDGREIGVSYHHGALWLKLWNAPNECHDNAPWADARSRKRQPVLHLDDLVLGRATHRSETLETFTGTLHLDDGYEVTARRFVSEWKRPRWPVPRRVMRVEIEIPSGIPIPGKGENGWDCEDDAIFARTTTASSIEEAARTLVADVQRQRGQR